jgi:hypothetical protein
MTTETTRAALHEALDAVPDEELWRVEYFLEYLRTGDTMLRTLCLAPYDDEPVTPEEEAAVQEGLDAYRRGDVKSLDEVRRELGL